MKVVTLGELLLRLSPEGYARFVQADRFNATYGGAEANVAALLARFGAQAFFVTKLPAHEIGQAALDALRRWGVDVSHVVRGGARLGLYYLEKGASQRAGKVIYDRADSAFACSSPEEYDWSAIFAGADWFHFTGITPALGERAEAVVRRACAEAKARGVTVSCDLNYRATLWPRERARTVLSQLMENVDVCISNADQVLDVFGMRAQGTGNERDAALAELLAQTFGLRAVALTRRKSVSASENYFSGMLWDGDAAFSREYDMHIVDRVGGGDAFAGGLIYALCGGEPAQQAIEFAAAAGCLKHTIEGDICLVSEQEVRSLAGGAADGRVRR